MDDQRKWELNVQFEQLKLLFDYTKFHIGLYTTLTAAYIALMTSEYGKRFLTPNRWFVWIAVLLFAIAGLAGGMIASSCPHYSRLDSLMSSRLAPSIALRIGRRLPYKAAAGFEGLTWTYIEHNSFWLGLAFAILSFFVGGPASAVAPSTLGSAIMFERIVSNGFDKKYPYQPLVELESHRSILICLEPNAGLEMMVVKPDGVRMQQIETANEAACTVVYGQGISARSIGKAHRVKVALILDETK